MLYLTISRLDIIFNVYICARYQANHKELHLLVVKKILRYLMGTYNIGLWYSMNSSIDLIAYSDVDFINYKLDRKNIYKIYQFIDINLIS